MSIQALTAKTRKHWAEWLPKRTKRLKAMKMWEVETQTAAQNAQEEIQSLMERGYPAFAAEEVALHKFILLKPEHDAEMPADQRRELDEMEREYQKAPMGG